ncbi:hypothetical protein [Robertmurraya sp.]|uniref:hypothetical protein n=1 Tax=Robertmurraya sp. TaxID=2837525 RepID=UPI0037037EE2
MLSSNFFPVSIELLVRMVLEASQSPKYDSDEYLKSVNDELLYWASDLVEDYQEDFEENPEDKQALVNGIWETLGDMSIWRDGEDDPIKEIFFNNLREYLGGENYFYRLVKEQYEEADEL